MCRLAASTRYPCKMALLFGELQRPFLNLKPVVLGSNKVTARNLLADETLHPYSCVLTYYREDVFDAPALRLSLVLDPQAA